MSQEPEGRQRGLGDTVAAVTRAVGIKPCGGCQKRREALNRAVPYESGLIEKARQFMGRWDGRPLKLKQVPGAGGQVSEKPGTRNLEPGT